jgi:hypothetical protein
MKCRDEVLVRDMWQCLRCGAPATEVAHRIANTRSNIKEIVALWFKWFGQSLSWGEASDIINHPMNLASSCRLCNDWFNCGFNPGEKFEILLKIAREDK